MIRRKSYWARYNGWYEKTEVYVDLGEISLVRTLADAAGNMKTELYSYPEPDKVIATIYHEVNKKELVIIKEYFDNLVNNS